MDKRTKKVPRRPWIIPRMRRLAGGSADFGGEGGIDGSGLS